MRAVLLTLALLAIAAVAGGAALLWSGWYDTAATAQHTQPVFSLLETAMHRSVKMRAAQIAVPRLDDAAQHERGAQCYVEKCLQCHGGPGMAQDEIGRSMQPVPGPLVDASVRWQPQELYLITRDGIKMSGMPAWQFRLGDDDLWALVAFLQQFPRLTAAQFGAFAAARDQGLCRTDPAPQATADTPADAERGRLALTQYACNACHRIPGVTGSDVHVGPPLAGIASRALIAGALPNHPAQMQRWIVDPQSVDPATTMPNMQVAPRDARDIAAYLATLR